MKFNLLIVCLQRLARILHEGGRTLISLCRVFNELPEVSTSLIRLYLSVWFYEQAGIASWAIPLHAICGLKTPSICTK